jgi:hypothetical protein
VSIPANKFFTVTPATNFKSKASGTLNGVDYFFYVADNHDLRVKTFEGVVSYTLAAGTQWVDTIQASDRIHVYFSSGNQVFYLEFRHFGSGDTTPTPVGIGSAFTTFSVNYAANCVPPAYLLLLNDGVNHNLYVASDPAFKTVLAASRIYSNAIDQAHYVTHPTIAMHPQDTNIATINIQQLKVSDGSTKVGFYVVQIPGVV